MTTWVSAADVIDAWIGDNAPQDDALLVNWIEKAEREVRFRIPDIQARIDAEADLLPPSTELLDNARDVVVAMVTRVFRNPEGFRQVNSTTGPFSQSSTYGGDAPGGLALTTAEINKLRGALVNEGAFAIDLIPATSPYATYRDPWGWLYGDPL
jgi:hypothetical protein